ATHFADLESESRSLEQVLIAAAFKTEFLFPICLRAQFTAFFTKLRSSEASRTIRGRKSRNVLSAAFLSCTASSAIRTNPALLTYSSFLLDHSCSFLTASSVLSNRFPQEPSTISHESKSATHFSI